ncbi:MAG: sulfite exporter TauE/SafE family protein [Chitinispirillaceae bacterium]|nr:sulfite exporter TauE/SafE family protein [Chitinispirillaceae bacterium]
MDDSTFILALLFLIIAFLYSSVGQGGASGYLAVMALFGVTTAAMRPTALVLNVIVATIASYKYCKARRFSLNTFIVFALFSVPCSFIGGEVQLPNRHMKAVIGVILIMASFAMIVSIYLRSDYVVGKIPVPVGLTCGGLIGFLSGLTSIGGGIFLSPLLMFFKWSSVRNTSGIAALFILVNSLSGLLGQISVGVTINANIWPFAAAVVIGGYAGSEFGSRKLNGKAIMIVLFAVLVMAAIRMFMP